MRIFLFGIMFIASIVVRAQEATPSFEQLKEYYQYASVDERVKMDSIFQTLENNLKDGETGIFLGNSSMWL